MQKYSGVIVINSLEVMHASMKNNFNKDSSNVFCFLIFIRNSFWHEEQLLAIADVFSKDNTRPRNNILKWGVCVLLMLYYLSDIFSLTFFFFFFFKEGIEDSNSLSPSPGKQELNKNVD